MSCDIHTVIRFYVYFPHNSKFKFAFCEFKFALKEPSSRFAKFKFAFCRI